MNSSRSTPPSHTSGGLAFRRGPQVSEGSHCCTHGVLVKARCTHWPPGLRVFFCGERFGSHIVYQGPCRSLGWMVFCFHTGWLCGAFGRIRRGGKLGPEIFLSDLLEAAPEIDIVIHDDACHLRKYAASRACKSPLARRLAYPQVKCVIDRFHSKGHVDHWCKQHCMHTSPENEKALQGVNTSVWEQQFSKLGRYKFMVSKMGAAIGAFSRIK